MSDIIVNGVNKSFDGRLVLKDVSITIKAGEFVSIMGESGSGKSTLLGIMSGNLRPDSGKVEVFGCDISEANEKKLAELRRTVLGYVYQFFNLVPTMTVRDNINLPLRLAGRKVAEEAAYFDELVSFLKIDKILDRYPEKLSGGEQQRVAIARALIHHPEVIFLDEPTGNLDSENAASIMNLLKELNEKYGTTIVQVTHSKQSTEYGGRVVTIKDGMIFGE